ncbi:related to AUT1-essential for autophagocytosis [Sporisorium reilianum f. sp. reilianum]|uniref:Autophagy-related protein 3 n=1 Tax=Sporisorium reilianum f. sp. reilianum TaxID=72559 RepID=A0A2N8U698_9BASI|nr:related to AUT1-essential for autophagocytosis [Sporisorium reilianum f. sp. reilianum]
MNALQTHFWAVREYLSPVLRESKFKEHGRITPDEFVAAGDFLSYKFPTWQWCAGSASKARDYLPKDKQFLISCGVPSLRRVSQIEKGVGVGVTDDDEKLMSFDEGGADAAEDDQWVATHFDDQQSGSASRAADMLDIPDIGEDAAAPEHQLTEGQEDDLAARVAGVSIAASSLEPSASADDIGDIPDMPDIPDMDDETDDLAGGVEEEDDPATAAPPALTTAASGSTSAADNGKLLSVRKYDCIITYDKYYQTPRMWLVGYDEHGVPLKPAQIFEDVSSDYAQKTVTIELFPHGHAGPDSSATSSASAVGVATASIHPCKHASVMKKVIERMNASVIEEQRKAAAASGVAVGGAGAGGEKKKKKGWSVSSAVKRVTGGAADSSASAAAEGKDAPAAAGAAGDGAATAAGGDQDDEVEGLRVDQYMIIFLKFMASIVPAIEIDATQAL